MATRDLSKGYYNLNPLLSSEMKPHSHERTPERVKAIRAIVEKPHTLFPLPPGGGYGRHDYCHWRVKNDVRAHTNQCFISSSSLSLLFVLLPTQIYNDNFFKPGGSRLGLSAPLFVDANNKAAGMPGAKPDLIISPVMPER